MNAVKIYITALPLVLYVRIIRDLTSVSVHMDLSGMANSATVCTG